MELVVLLVVALLAFGGAVVFGIRMGRKKEQERARLHAASSAHGPGAWAPISSTPARYSSSPPGKRGTGPAHRYDPYSLKVGDRVILDDRPGVVLATIGYTEDVYGWASACIGHGTKREWITVVTEDAGAEIVRWTKLSELPGKPDDQSITYDGVVYLYQEMGRAQFTAAGEVDLPSSGYVEYADFHAGDLRLSFENFNDFGWEASVGRVLPIGELVRADAL